MATSFITHRGVNIALKDAGLKLKLIKNEASFSFIGPDLKKDIVVLTERINSKTVQEWVELARRAAHV